MPDKSDNLDESDTSDIPLTPELYVRKAIHLRITVVGRQVEDQVIELASSGEEITLANESVSLTVANIARADGLPLGVEKMFDVWFRSSDLRDSLREVAKIAYLSGMIQGGLSSNGHGRHES